MSKYRRETLHLLQYHPELRAHHSQTVVFFLRPSHAHRTSGRRKLGIVWYEVTLLVYRPTPATVVQFKVAGNDALAGPALEHQTSLVSEAHFATGQRREVPHHLRRYIRPSFDQDTTERSPVHLDVEVEYNERRIQRLHGDGRLRR